ncbi:MAG: YiiD C-terminal domain-containing protein [Bacteroidota bacterium]
MSPAEVETYLHDHIPISAAHGITVAEASPEAVRLAAPLDVNINHFNSVYGGSASSVAILSAWTLLHLRLSARGWRGRVVIQRSEVNYLRPTVADFEAICEAPEDAIWERFVSTLERRGRARLPLTSRLVCEGEVTARFDGDYVALAAPEDERT